MSEMSPETPVPLARGKFSLYETPTGAMRLIWRLDDADEDGRFELPSGFAQVLREHAAAGTPPNPLKLMGLMRHLIGGRG